MKISWSPEAGSDLAGIYDHIAADNPFAADRIQTRIIQATESLSTLSDRGRPGRLEGTRELILIALPYFIVYQWRSDTVFIVRIVHSHRLWPPSGEDR